MKRDLIILADISTAIIAGLIAMRAESLYLIIPFGGYAAILGAFGVLWASKPED